MQAVLAFLQEQAQEPGSSNTVVRIVAGALAVILIAIIIMRRKAKAKKAQDEF